MGGLIAMYSDSLQRLPKSIAAGKIATEKALEPIVDRVMPLAEASGAHAYVAGNEGFGKVVLEVD